MESLFTFAEIQRKARPRDIPQLVKELLEVNQSRGSPALQHEATPNLLPHAFLHDNIPTAKENLPQRGAVCRKPLSRAQRSDQHLIGLHAIEMDDFVISKNSQVTCLSNLCAQPLKDRSRTPHQIIVP